jgi:hypothetical protein
MGRNPRRNNGWRGALALLVLASCCTTPGVAVGKVRPVAKAASSGVGAARAIAHIAAQRERCGNRGDPGPNEMQDCDTKAWASADALLRRSHQNDHFDDLLNDLSDALLFVLTPGDEGEHDALAQRVVVTGSFADLALKRAAILTGAEKPGALRATSRKPRPLFAWLDTTPGLRKWTRGDPDRNDISRRWARIRDTDCAAYPVPRCAERLDGAMRAMIKTMAAGK